MKKAVFSLFLILTLLLMVGVVSAEYDRSCCVNSVISPTDDYPVLAFDTCNYGFIKVSDCIDTALSETNPEVLEVGCCCDGSNVHVSPTASSISAEYTSKKYCESLGFVSAPLGTKDACTKVCSAVQSINYNNLHVQINGTVKGNFSDKPNLINLEGAAVQSVYNGDTIYVNSDGIYNLGTTPGNPLGSNEFRAFLSRDNTYGYDCSPSIVRKILTNDEEINFVLDCVASISCETDWEESPWSEYCYPFGNEYFRIRTVIDKSEDKCASKNNLTHNIPLREPCDIDSVELFGTCGNNILDLNGNEQCDGGKFVDPTTGNETNSLSCAQSYSTLYSSGEVRCDDATCTYDYSDCSIKCDETTCRNKIDCDNDCPICNNNFIVCDDRCESEQPDFLSSWRFTSGILETSRNIFSLYTLLNQEGGSTTIPIQYREGTNDVRLEWSYINQCKETIKGYNVYVCEEDDDTNFCKSQSTQELFIPNATQTAVWFEDVLEADTSYCYNICAVGFDGTESCSINESDEKWPCFTTGSEICMDENKQPGLNCEYDSRMNQKLPKGCITEKFGSTYFTNLSLTPTTDDLVLECSGKICVENEYKFEEGSDFLGAECKPAATCGLCNGLFGLYADYNLNTKIVLTSSYLEGGIESPKCFDLEYSFLDGKSVYPTSDNFVGLCYKDSSLTSFNKFDTCENVNSCYDYKGQSACLNDPCFKFIDIDGEEPVQGCDWTPLGTLNSKNELVDELGIGVCRPVDEDLQDCTKCDYTSPLGFCNEEQCNLYGDCFFKENLTHGSKQISPLIGLVGDQARSSEEELFPACINKKDVSCYMYDTKEQCIGSNNKDVGVDVIYNITSKKRIFGSNAITSESNDTRGIGLCTWNDNSDLFGGYGCVKDADGSNQYENKDKDGNVLSSDKELLVDDCALRRTPSLDCLSDVTPPETFILEKEETEFMEKDTISSDPFPVYGLEEIKHLDLFAKDDVSSTEKITTYVGFVSLLRADCYSCIPPNVISILDLNDESVGANSLFYRNFIFDIKKGKIGGICSKKLKSGNLCDFYPTREFDLNDPDYELPSQLSDGGAYGIIYYSEDEAHNLEVVKGKKVYIDAKGPTISSLLISNVSEEVAEDVYRTKLTVKTTIANDGNVTCEGNLLDKEGNYLDLAGDIVTQKLDFSTTYLNLPDGEYNFTLSCTDQYRNPTIKSTAIVLDGDRSILNPNPRGASFNSTNIILNVTTNDNAVCYYSIKKDKFGDDTQKFTAKKSANGQYIHTVNFNTFDLSQTGTWLNNYEFSLFVNCTFDDGNVTSGQAGDVIYFSVDTRPPKTTLQSKKQGIPILLEENLDFEVDREIIISCDDSNELTRGMYFGCEKIEYCYGNYTSTTPYDFSTVCNSSVMVIENEARNVNDKTISATRNADYRYIGSQMHIYYRSTDKGGNVEQIQRRNLRIRNTDFVDPIFAVTRIY